MEGLYWMNRSPHLSMIKTIGLKMHVGFQLLTRQFNMHIISYYKIKSFYIPWAANATMQPNRAPIAVNDCNNFAFIGETPDWIRMA